MKTVKFALIGCGRISPNHFDAISKVDIAELVAVCDIDIEKAKNAAEKYNVPKYYGDIDEMLDNEDVDVCCILTPSGVHAETAMRVAKRKVNILCEKPLDVSIEKMQQLIDCCKENNVKLGAVFQRRFFEAAIRTKEAIEKGWLGKVTLGDAYLKYYRDQEYYDSGDWRGTWELDGGGAFMNQGVHGVDMIAWIMGGIKSVNAQCERLNWNIDVEDTGVVRVEYKNGAIGVIECCTTAYPGHDSIFSVCGTEGAITFGDRGFYTWELKDKTKIQPEVTGSMGGRNCKYSAGNYGHTMHIDDMARAVLEDRDPEITGEEAMNSVKMILAIYESSRQKKTIELDEF